MLPTRTASICHPPSLPAQTITRTRPSASINLCKTKRCSNPEQNLQCNEHPTAPDPTTFIAFNISIYPSNKDLFVSLLSHCIASNCSSLSSPSFVLHFVLFIAFHVLASNCFPHERWHPTLLPFPLGSLYTSFASNCFYTGGIQHCRFLLFPCASNC